jgi:hypothetical protein
MGLTTLIKRIFGNTTNLFVILIIVVLFIGFRLYDQGAIKLPSFGNQPPNTQYDGTKVGELRIYPDPNLTPGKVYKKVTKEDVCTSGYSKRVRDVASATKHKVYENYKLSYPKSDGSWEVDHFIPLGIGGSNDISNLWPEPASPKPGFLEKDVVENYLHKEICSGNIDIKVAQFMIHNDWYKVYKSIPKNYKF